MRKADHKKIMLLVMLLLALGCCGAFGAGKAKSPAVPEIAMIQNRFFTLDFTGQSCEMADVEQHFFTTFPHDDPTQGDVVYDRKKWLNADMLKLVKADGLYLYIKARPDSLMFDSFRLTTKSYFNLNQDNQRILFVFKGSLPSAKGLWPAWWLNGSQQDQWRYHNSGTVATDAVLDKLSGIGHFYNTPSAVNGTDWPGSGEIDIIETINGNNIIHNTIHTCPQMCDSEWNNDGKIINCANARSGDPNAGCSGQPYALEPPEGTFACLWEKDVIRFYYWPPEYDVRKAGGPLSKLPNPVQWKGDVLKNTVKLLETDVECENALHQEWQCTSCESSTACVFVNLKMIFNATLCGKWAGREFDDSETPLENCRSYILNQGKNVIQNQFLKIEYVSVIGI